MNKKHIQDLLDKYFEGETSLGEEKELKDFFRKTVLLPEEWKSYKQMFAIFESESKVVMPVKKDAQKKKNIFWLAVTGISLAASALILLTVFIPPTKKQLEPLAIATKQLDTFYAKKVQTKKEAPTRKVLIDDASTILASNRNAMQRRTTLSTTIDDALAPLDKMQDIKNAMDKFKYFDLMNKYLPGRDISKIIRSNK
jgi:hypothetical protein